MVLCRCAHTGCAWQKERKERKKAGTPEFRPGLLILFLFFLFFFLFFCVVSGLDSRLPVSSLLISSYFFSCESFFHLISSVLSCSRSIKLPECVGELSEAQSIVQRLLFFSPCNSSSPTTVASLGVEEKPLACVLLQDCEHHPVSKGSE